VLYRIYKLEPKARVCDIRYNTDANVVNDLKNDSVSLRPMSSLAK
jgi:hypothetical protein